MSRTTGIVQYFAAALVAVVLAAALVPLCTMPECGDTGAAVCGGFVPACDDCPQPVLMRHERSDAAAVAAPATLDLVSVPAVADDPVAVPVAVVTTAPAPTASPPPLDPLGVRLLI